MCLGPRNDAVAAAADNPMLPRIALPQSTPKSLALEYGVYGAREPPAHVQGQIQKPGDGQSGWTKWSRTQ